MRLKKCLSIITVLTILFIGFAFIYSVNAKGYEISVSIPGVKELVAGKEITDPGAYVKGLYNFAIGIAGILAVGMIVYGAVERIVYVGNSARQTEGKERITNAILGLLLLLAAVLILNTIRPEITSLSLPTFETIVEVKKPSAVESAEHAALKIAKECTEKCKDSCKDNEECKKKTGKKKTECLEGCVSLCRERCVLPCQNQCGELCQKECAQQPKPLRPTCIRQCIPLCRQACEM